MCVCVCVCVEGSERDLHRIAEIVVHAVLVLSVQVTKQDKCFVHVCYLSIHSMCVVSIMHTPLVLFLCEWYLLLAHVCT